MIKFIFRFCSGDVYSRSLCVKWSKRGDGSPENWCSQSSVYPTKVHVFGVAYGRGDLFGPYFIEGTLTSDSYICMLREEVFPGIRRTLGEELFSRAVWQQDGASPHRTRAALDFITSVFGSRIIGMNSGRVGGIDYPAASPDLTTMDYYTWDALSREVYYGENPPTDWRTGGWRSRWRWRRRK